MPALYSLVLFENDPQLGYRLRKEMTGWYVLPSLDSIPVFTGREGHRIDNRNEPCTDSLLFLGDSFTFGEACLADSTYAFLSSRNLNRCALNFGTGGYGLAQMWHIYINSRPGRTWIIQWSPWLAERAVRGKLDGKMIIIPTPVLMPDGDTFSFIPPAYASELFPLSTASELEPYRPRANRPKSFLSFLAGPGYTIYSNQLSSECSKFFRSSPNTDDAEFIHDAFVRKLNKLAITRKDTIIFMLIGYSHRESLLEEKKLKRLSTFPILNASAWLYQQKDSMTESEYESRYMHWDSAHSNILDRHPNPLAHRLIADKVIDYFRKLWPK